MNKQTTDTILMVQPVAFDYNEQTAANNFFQQNDAASGENIQQRALEEFDAMVETLRANKVNVIVARDTGQTHTPDSIFPNNWISFHGGGQIAIYPMFAPNRRAERNGEVLKVLGQNGFHLGNVMDYTRYEQDDRFLEGTGSMALDRTNKIAYASISERTDAGLFHKFCHHFGYRPVAFNAFQTVGRQRLPVYHTNVMMCIGTRYAVVCLTSIDDAGQRNMVIDSLCESGKEVINISERQMHSFAGNMLQVENTDGKPLLVLSQAAFDSLGKDQIKKLTAYNALVPIAVPTIEQYGGGSVRCMMTEVLF